MSFTESIRLHGSIRHALEIEVLNVYKLSQICRRHGLNYLSDMLMAEFMRCSIEHQLICKPEITYEDSGFEEVLI